MTPLAATAAIALESAAATAVNAAHKTGRFAYGRGLHAGRRYRVRGVGLCQGGGAGRGAGDHRAVADLLDRAYADRSGAAGLAGSRLRVLRRHAARRARRSGELFL